jgi:hypothetical protein
MAIIVKLDIVIAVMNSFTPLFISVFQLPLPAKFLGP